MQVLIDEESINICSNFILIINNIYFPKKINFTHFDLKNIVKNNFLVKEQDIQNLLLTVYGKI